MSVNKFKILFSEVVEKGLNIPIEMNWDFMGRGMAIDEYQEKTSREVLNLDKDFEVARFAHSDKTDPNNLTKTDINYEFYFVNTAVTATNIATAQWGVDYRTQGFSPKEIYYFTNPFKKSFFKLDFYDSPFQSGQTNYVTIILPTQQGLTTKANVGFQTNVDIKIPKFKLDFVGDKEGFFIYWLKNRDFLNIPTLYMTAKFFDAKSGIFIKMMNTRQRDISVIPPSNQNPSFFNFKPEDYFYYKVKLDYSDFTYKVYNVLTNEVVGHETKPIKWYEYVNP
jgi:hypothetical protein